MYSTDSFDGLIITICVLLSSILLLGLVLSIAVFYTKSRLAEIVAWICSSAWLVLYIALKRFNVILWGDILDFYIYPILLIFLLLLNYRTNILFSRAKIIYFIKAVVFLFFLSSFFSLVMTKLMASGIVDIQNTYQMTVINIVQVAVFWTVLVVFCIQYLQKTNIHLLKMDIFKYAVFYTCCSLLVVNLIGNLMFILTFNIAEGIALKSAYSNWILWKQLGYLVFGSIISALVATFIYDNKVQAKNGEQLKV